MAMKYLFPSSMPYDDLTFIDQSAYTETTPLEEIATIPEGPIAFIPFVSPRGYGEDNKLMYMDSARLAKYGNPNLKKYGLSLYLANRFVEGGGTLLGMRMMPKDASYANRCVYAEVGKTYNVPTEEGTTGKYPNVKTFKKIQWTLVDGENTESFDELRPSDSESFAITDGTNNIEILTSLPETDTNIYGYYTQIGDSYYYIVKTNSTYDLYKIATNGITINTDNETATVSSSAKYASVTVNEITSVKYKVGFIPGNETLYPKWTDSTKCDDFKVYNDNTTTTEVTETDGSKIYPLFIVRSKAKGEFAKAFKFKFTLDDTMNSQYSNRCFYKFSSLENGSKLDGDMTFTFDDDFVYGDDSLGVRDVFDKYAANLTMFKASGFDDFKKEIKEAIKNSDTEYTSYTDDQLDELFYASDFLFGTMNTYNAFVVVPDETNGIENTNLSKYDLNALNGSSLDGSIAGKTFATFGDKSFTDPFADMFVEVYGGDIQADEGIYTDLIYDEVRFPFEYILVPSYDNGVMNAAYDLASNRHITRVFFTYPKFDTYKDAREWSSKNMSSFNEFISSEYCEWWQVKDPYTKKNTMMPSTYFNAYGLPYHWLHNKGVPYAGTRNYRWSGGKVGTMTPCSVNPNEYIANHNAGLNTMIEDGLGYASPYEQITSQQKKITSQLSELNNATILMNMARIALRMSSDARWTTLSDEEVSSFISDVETAIQLALNGTYSSLRIEGERESVNGAGRNRIHCKFYVNFNDMLKGVTYEFYILAN